MASIQGSANRFSAAIEPSRPARLRANSAIMRLRPTRRSGRSESATSSAQIAEPLVDRQSGHAYIAGDNHQRLAMTSITISNIDDNLKQRLMERAAQHGRSMEVEAREILENVLVGTQRAAVPDNLYDAIRAIIEPLGG